MLQIYEFLEYLGANPYLATLVGVLGIILHGLSQKKLEYKVEDENGKEVKIYKYK